MEFTAAQRGAAGIAAPQVGVGLQVFLVSGHTLGVDKLYQVFINPTLETSGDELTEREGCLSFPGISLFIKRPALCKVTATNENGEEFTMELSGFASRAVQHENDHIIGKLMIDHVSSIKAKLVKEKLRKNLRKLK